MEPEEAPNRAASSSSDMMSTIRDDPDHQKELLALKQQIADAKKKKSAPALGRAPTPAAPSAVSYNAAPQVAPVIAPPAKNKSPLALIISAVSVLILIVVLLLVFKVI
jgi:hypothetical protein